MNSKISKILSIVTGVISLIGVFFLIRIIMVGDDSIKESVDVQNSIISPYITFAKVILYLTAIIAIVFSLWNLIKNPKLLKKTLLSLVVLGILLAIAYSTADDSATLNASGLVVKDGEAGSTSKWASTGITYALVLGGLGILAIFAGFVKSLVRK